MLTKENDGHIQHPMPISQERSPALLKHITWLALFNVADIGKGVVGCSGEIGDETNS